MQVKNAYTESPADVEPGDQFLFVIKAIVTVHGKYKLYRCPWQPGVKLLHEGLDSMEVLNEDVPQGDKIYGDSIERDIFPILGRAGLKRED